MEIEWNFESYQDFEQLAKTASKFTAAVEWKFRAGRVTGSRYPVHQYMYVEQVQVGTIFVWYR